MSRTTVAKRQPARRLQGRQEWLWQPKTQSPYQSPQSTMSTTSASASLTATASATNKDQRATNKNNRKGNCNNQQQLHQRPHSAMLPTTASATLTMNASTTDKNDQKGNWKEWPKEQLTRITARATATTNNDRINDRKVQRRQQPPSATSTTTASATDKNNRKCTAEKQTCVGGRSLITKKMQPLRHSIPVDLSLHYSDLNGNGNGGEKNFLTVVFQFKCRIEFRDTVDACDKSTSHLNKVFTYGSVVEKFSSSRVFVSLRRVVFRKLPERSMAGIVASCE